MSSNNTSKPLFPPIESSSTTLNYARRVAEGGAMIAAKKIPSYSYRTNSLLATKQPKYSTKQETNYLQVELDPKTITEFNASIEKPEE